MDKATIRALRTADEAIVFRHNSDGHAIEAHHRNSDSSLYSIKTVVPVCGQFSIYSDAREDGDAVVVKYIPLTAFEMIHGPRFHAVWQTVSRAIREDDTITLLWIANNNSDIIRKSDLTIDELQIKLTSPRRKQPAVYKIDHRVTSLHSSARMIRYDVHKESIDGAYV